MELKNKKIIVTGAGNGIGRELTIQLIGKGAYVLGLDIDKKALETTKKMVDEKKISTYVVDMSSYESIVDFKKKCFKDHKAIDGIINNAGIIQPFVTVAELEDHTVNKVMGVNFYGPLNLIREFLPELLKRKTAHIVNVSSMGGFFPFPRQSIYGSSKAALKIFTEGLYSELLNTNVKVTLVFPGAIETDIVKNSNVNSEAVGAKIKMTTPQAAAKAIINAMEKDKFKVYIGNDSKMMNILYKLNSKFAIKFINKMMN